VVLALATVSPAALAGGGKGPSGNAFGDYLAGRIAQGAGDWGAAAHRLSAALANDPGNASLVRRAFLLHLGEGNQDEALKLARAMKADGESFLAATLLVADDIAQGRVQDALVRVQGLPSDGLGQYVTPLLVSWARVAAGDHEGALAALAPLQSVPGFTALWHLQAALVEDLRGNEAAAADHYGKALEGGTPLRLVQLAGNFHERHGRASTAQALYAAFRAEQPDSPMPDGSSTVKRSSPPKPLVAGARDGLAEALLDVASALHQEGAQEMALLYGRVALFLRPELDLARLLVGDVMMARERFEAAIAAFRRIDGEPGLVWMARLREADALRRLERDDDAAKLLETLAAKRPDRIEALVRLGDIHRAKGRHDAAITAYDRAIGKVGQAGAKDWVLFYARALAHDAAGRWPEAEADLRRAVELQPNQPSVLNYLGYSWIDRGMHLDRAEALIAKAAELRPDDGYIIDSLGWAKYRRGDYHGAIEQLERAVEMRPLDATINDHLGDAYWAVGRKLEARFQWERAAQMAAENPTLRSAVERKLRDGLPLPKTAESRPDGVTAH